MSNVPQAFVEFDQLRDAIDFVEGPERDRALLYGQPLQLSYLEDEWQCSGCGDINNLRPSDDPDRVACEQCGKPRLSSR